MLCFWDAYIESPKFHHGNRNQMSWIVVHVIEHVHIILDSNEPSAKQKSSDSSYFWRGACGSKIMDSYYLMTYGRKSSRLQNQRVVSRTFSWQSTVRKDVGIRLSTSKQHLGPGFRCATLHNVSSNHSTSTSDFSTNHVRITISMAWLKCFDISQGTTAVVSSPFPPQCLHLLVTGGTQQGLLVVAARHICCCNACSLRMWWTSRRSLGAFSIMSLHHVFQHDLKLLVL